MVWRTDGVINELKRFPDVQLHVVFTLLCELEAGYFWNVLIYARETIAHKVYLIVSNKTI